VPEAGRPAWTEDVAFVEVHRHGRVLVRGTFAGRYLDERDLGAAEGNSVIVTELLADIPEGSSGLMAFAPPDEIDRFVAGFDGRALRASRRRVSAQEAASIESAVASAPAATATTREES
jgi:hypothetical protein